MSAIGGFQSGIGFMRQGMEQIRNEMQNRMGQGAGNTEAGRFEHQMRGFGGDFPGMGGEDWHGSSDDDGQDAPSGGVGPGQGGWADGGGGDAGSNMDSSTINDLLQIIQQLTDMLNGSSSDDAPGSSPMGGDGTGNAGFPSGSQPSPTSVSNTEGTSGPVGYPTTGSGSSLPTTDASSGAGGGLGSTSDSTSSSGGGSMGFLKNGKEGLGVSPTSANGADVAGKNASWYYDWSPQPQSSSQSNGAQFIPMVWGQKDMTAENLQSIKNSNAPMVLAFNEPDQAGQSNMSVSQAVSDWPQLEQAAAGKQLSSPAVSSSPQGTAWLNDFLGQANQKGLKVDSIAVHWYGDASQSVAQNVANLKSYIQSIQNLPNANGRPIDLTEFGLSPNGNSAQANPEFLAAAEKMLNDMPGVQMYAPYGLGAPGGNS